MTDTLLLTEMTSQSSDNMRAVVTVLGVNQVGIVAGVSTLLASSNVSILDIRQTLMSDLFSMVMVVDLAGATATLSDLKEQMSILADELGVKIYLQHEEILRYMHSLKKSHFPNS